MSQDEVKNLMEQKEKMNKEKGALSDADTEDESLFPSKLSLL